MSNAQYPLIDAMTEASVGFHKLPDGKRMRYALMWPKGDVRGTIVVGLGRREFIEKKFSELGVEFLDRGFRIIIFEWRGQALSDRFLEGTKYQRDYIQDFSIHIDDFDHLFEAIVKPNRIGPLILSGHSMGSHLLLRWMMERGDALVSALILTAPMLAIAGNMAHASASLVSWSALKLGYGDDYAAAQHDYNEQDRVFTNNPLTHDPVRFTFIEKYFHAYPELAIGGITWQWLHAAVKSMQITQRRSHLEAVDVPVLTITGSHDRVTPINEIERFLRLMPRATNVTIAGARHDILNEIEDYRREAWVHIDQFIKRVLPIAL